MIGSTEHSTIPQSAGLRLGRNTVEVYVRHSGDCGKKSKGRYFRGCTCMKWLYIYREGTKEERSAKTRSWEDAERSRQEILDSWDPVKMELAKLKADQQSKRVLIEEALRLFIQDLVVSNRSPNTIKQRTVILGNPGQPVKKFNGDPCPVKLMTYLDKHNAGLSEVQKALYLDDLTPQFLMRWRSTWKFNDLTIYGYWLSVIIFFNWCMRQGWITYNPAKKLTVIQLQKGSRTTVFSDEEYQRVLEAAKDYALENRDPQTKAAIARRITTFIETLRWGGMSIMDAVLLKPEKISSDGTLVYRRAKTGMTAVVPLPNRLLTLLRELPPERDSDPAYYFRNVKYGIESEVRRWKDRIDRLFEQAGITEVEAELRKRAPHPHMFRDTFAVNYITQGVPLHMVSKMLGHSSTTITERAYLPWVQKMEQHLLSTVRQSWNQPEAPVVSITAARKRRA